MFTATVNDFELIEDPSKYAEPAAGIASVYI